MLFFVYWEVDDLMLGRCIISVVWVGDMSFVVFWCMGGVVSMLFHYFNS